MNIKDIIDQFGARKVAEVCGITVRGVYKWRALQALPRTDYTGETHYSALLAKAFRLSKKQILEMSKPQVVTL